MIYSKSKWKTKPPEDAYHVGVEGEEALRAKLAKCHFEGVVIINREQVLRDNPDLTEADLRSAENQAADYRYSARRIL